MEGWLLAHGLLFIIILLRFNKINMFKMKMIENTGIILSYKRRKLGTFENSLRLAFPNEYSFLIIRQDSLQTEFGISGTTRCKIIRVVNIGVSDLFIIIF